MDIPDKFGVIINSTTPDLKMTKCEITTYFENLIKNNNRMFMPSIINNNLSIDPSISDKLILDNLTDYVKEIRKNLRQNLRRGIKSNLINVFISSLTNYSNKVYQLEYFINNTSNDDTFRVKCYYIFLSLVVSDPTLKEVFKKDLMNISSKKETNFLLSKIQKINPEFYQEWCIGFIKGCLNSYSNISSNLISAEYPISKNLIPIYEFSCYVKFLTEYKDHFKCIDDQTIFGDIIENLINKIYSVSDHNDVKTFNEFIKNNNEAITTYIIPYLTKDQIDDLETTIIVKVYEKYKRSESLESICDFYINISKYFSKIFHISIIIMSKDMAKFIIENSLVLELTNILITKLENCIKNDTYDTVSYLFNIISYFDDKNIIFDIYHRELMLRLLGDNVKDIEYENLLVTKLTRSFNCRQCYKLSKTIEDVEKSIEFKKYMVDLLVKAEKVNLTPSKWSIVNTTYNIWESTVFDIATRLDTLKSCSGNICNFLKLYSNVYGKTHKNSRYLNWYLHTGSVVISYKTTKGDVVLKLLPLQALVLEQFDTHVDYITMDQYINLPFLSSYEMVEREKLLDIFIENDILVSTCDIDSNKITINLTRQSCTELNLIDKFFEISSLPIAWHEEELVQTANNKEDIVKTKINHHIKTKALNYGELFTLCKDINVFKLDDELFKKSLDSMISSNYIELNEESNMYIKLVY
jgi:hypothetical protein